MLQSSQPFEEVYIKKKILVDPQVDKEFESINPEVRRQVLDLLKTLSREGYLIAPYGKKLFGNMFEIRILQPESWRIIYSYLEGDIVVLLTIFKKKSNRTPIKELQLAKKRLNSYYR